MLGPRLARGCPGALPRTCNLTEPRIGIVCECELVLGAGRWALGRRCNSDMRWLSIPCFAMHPEAAEVEDVLTRRGISSTLLSEFRAKRPTTGAKLDDQQL
ncbi:hypothetical protein CPLU01_06466 [Colletotrichum plurivorum]|uniref:Uncharacterized protein n=1 Tax=Colletotrichum plurivorum TaxID=2175906 RepID=A0A8H6NFX3_9PEZI|nr:hypothetical protein CPLU01_06466 [Colletotrichum plurivorum]